MKIFTSLLVGTTALSLAALTSMPARADAGVGIHVGPIGVGVEIGEDQYRDNCRDYGYRHRYYDNCNRYRFDDAYYNERGEDYRWQQEHHRHDDRNDDDNRDRHNDHDNNDGSH